MSWFTEIWEAIWSKVLTNQKKLTATGGVIVGVILTLTFKDLYPDLQYSFERRLRRLQRSSIPHPPPGQADYVRLEDHTRKHSKAIVSAADPRRSSVPEDLVIPDGVDGLIGNTPLIRLLSLSEETGCEVLAKCEFLNGAGNSPKDRVALSMINHAEAEGLLVPGRGDTIYEGTVGSTGISLAAVARGRGYKAHICMPSDQAQEKSDLLSKLGATVERVKPAGIVDKDHFVNTARRRAQEHTDDSQRAGRGYFADQFENESNYLAHFETTGPEILAQTAGQIDAFVAGAGTGGTISGVALALKPMIPALKVVLADPQGSGLYNKVKYGVMFSTTEAEGTRRRHQVDSIVEGIGLTRQTANLNAGFHLIDDAVKVTDHQAMLMARYLVEKEGLFVGASSSVNVVAAAVVARQMASEGNTGARIVTVLCDSGTRHLSKFWKEAANVSTTEDVSLDDILAQNDHENR